MMSVIQVQSNPLFPRGIGIESVHFLNEEHSDMRHHFDYGDNNDGITIVDGVSRKYCMMNIYEYKAEKGERGIYTLPHKQPVSAREYMSVYYGETPETMSEYSKRDKTEKQIIALAKKYTKGNAKIERAINRASSGVLTNKEIKKLFPKMTELVVI